jgi:hypothetical protein
MTTLDYVCFCVIGYFIFEGLLAVLIVYLDEREET